jgi:hypothetical protein
MALASERTEAPAAKRTLKGPRVALAASTWAAVSARPFFFGRTQAIGPRMGVRGQVTEADCISLITPRSGQVRCVECRTTTKGNLFTMKYAVLCACAVTALTAAPVGASAADGVPGGMSYGFQRGSEIAGPVIGGIPGAVVGGVTGGVEGVLGIDHHPQYVAAREEYRPIHRAPRVLRRHHRHHND